jgi:hypothetical protein
MGFLDRISVRAKLVMLVAVPLLALMIFAGQRAATLAQERSVAVEVERLIEQAQVLSALIHELQIERGLSAGFIASGGDRGGSQLRDQRQKSDQALAAVRAFLDRESVSLAVMNDLNKLAEHRKQVDRTGLSVAQGVGFYTRSIADMLLEITKARRLAQVSDIKDALTAHGFLLRAKEALGQTRANLNAVFTQDRFAGEQVFVVGGLLGRVEADLDRFSTEAGQELSALLKSQWQGGPVAQMNQMIEVAKERYSTGGFGVDPGEWFRASTASIDRLKMIEDASSEAILTTTRSYSENVSFWLWFTVGLIGFLLVAVVLISVVAAKSIMASVNRAIAVIVSSNSQLVSASDQIATSATNLAEGASTQASSVEQVSASIEESTAVNNQNAQNAKEASRLAGEANEAASGGDAKVKELMRSMTGITEASEQIAKIIKTIDEIAFQTNLLALNAAVEAARAGEHGLGFAVVADEVKNLAGRSAQAAKETAGIIETAIEQIHGGSRVASQANEAFGQIVERVAKTTALVGEISESIKEQAEGMNQVATAMGQIDQITQQNAATSEEAAAAAEQLNAQTTALLDQVSAAMGLTKEQIEAIGRQY